MFVYVHSADTVDSITPDKVRGLRDMLNSSAMDIMYYTSPLYRDEVRLFSAASLHSDTLLFSSNMSEQHCIMLCCLTVKYQDE